MKPPLLAEVDGRNVLTVSPEALEIEHKLIPGANGATVRHIRLIYHNRIVGEYIAADDFECGRACEKLVRKAQRLHREGTLEKFVATKAKARPVCPDCSAPIRGPVVHKGKQKYCVACKPPPEGDIS
jgi:hypothetical protein